MKYRQLTILALPPSRSLFQKSGRSYSLVPRLHGALAQLHCRYHPTLHCPTPFRQASLRGCGAAVLGGRRVVGRIKATRCGSSLRTRSAEVQLRRIVDKNAAPRLFIRNPLAQQPEELEIVRRLTLHRRMRPVRREQHALGPALHEFARKGAIVLVMRRAALRPVIPRALSPNCFIASSAHVLSVRYAVDCTTTTRPSPRRSRTRR